MSIILQYNNFVDNLYQLSPSELQTELLSANTAFFELNKDRVINMFKRDPIFHKISWLEIDNIYQQAVCEMQKTLQKKQSQNQVSKCCETHTTARLRLLSCMKNLFDFKRKYNILKIKKALELEFSSYTNLSSNSDIYEIQDELIYIFHKEPDRFKNSLRRMYLDIDFDDFEKICALVCSTPSDILGFDPNENLRFSQVKNESGNVQLCFDIF